MHLRAIGLVLLTVVCRGSVVAAIVAAIITAIITAVISTVITAVITAVICATVVIAALAFGSPFVLVSCFHLTIVLMIIQR